MKHFDASQILKPQLTFPPLGSRTDNPSTSKPLLLSLYPLAQMWRMVNRTTSKLLCGKLKLTTKGSEAWGEVGEKCCQVLLRNLKQHNTTETVVVGRTHPLSVATMRNTVHLRKRSGLALIWEYV